ncbi:MAG: bifunctional metallophosphatase/5'-nucleotidase [Bacteroidales bacterium]|jgi:2',3'-cyclic-nucleotide 2'-phosphodiesterase/3'-nucleotidase|nr:bifunctional metallophosphatase/5'-nucleotidase [Bacteroidales bacterium]
MKKFTGSIIFVAILSFVFSSCSVRRDGSYHIELYTTNDVHGNFFNYGEGASSLSNLLGYVNSRRDSIGAGNVALVDLGDALQGTNTIYYYNFVDTSFLKKGGEHVWPAILSYEKYDAALVGNHDLEATPKVYENVYKNLREAGIPYLAANAVNTGNGKAHFGEYCIFSKNNIKIALIGLTTPNVTDWIPQSSYPGMRFEPVAMCADSLVGEVKKRRPDIIVVAMHSGFGTGELSDGENAAKYVAEHVKGIDLVLCAHDHRKINTKCWNGNDSVPVMESGAHAAYLGRVNIDLDFARGKLVNKRISASVLNGSDLTPDDNYDRKFKMTAQAAESFANRKIAEIDYPLNSADSFFGPSYFINMINYVLKSESGADIVFSAPLSMKYKRAAGIVRYRDLQNIYPYENNLKVVRLTGNEIKRYLEHSYDMWIKTVKAKDDHLLNIYYDTAARRYVFKYYSFNFDSAYGIDYTVDINKTTGDRIRISGFSNGGKFSMDSSYNVALTSYRANGGGNMLSYATGIDNSELDTIIVKSMGNIREMIYEYLSEGKLDKPINEKNWEFIPSHEAAMHMKRDRALMHM